MKTRQVRCGDVLIGGGWPVSIQSMTNVDSHDERALTEQISALRDAGCQIVRIAVPDREAAEVLGRVRKQAGMPVVADIHFDCVRFQEKNYNVLLRFLLYQLFQKDYHPALRLAFLFLIA